MSASPPPNRDTFPSVPGYRILRILGSGYSGTVYLALQERFSRQVALKLLLPERVRDPDAWTRFQREARALACLPHPCLTPLLDAVLDR